MEAWKELKENYLRVMNYGVPPEQHMTLNRLNLSVDSEKLAQLQGKPREEILAWFKQLQDETLKCALTIRNSETKESKHIDGLWFPQYERRHMDDVFNKRHWRYWKYHVSVWLSGYVNAVYDWFEWLPVRLNSIKARMLGKNITLVMVFPDGIPFNPENKSL